MRRRGRPTPGRRPTLRKRLWAWFKYLLFLGMVCVVFLLLCEGVLRVCFGLPRGYFHFRPLDNSALYLPNATLDLVLGPIPYRVHVNNLGFRGPDLAREKPAGVTRVAALGDSVTDGFYVENENTYPCQLERFLRERNINAEVVNAGRGDISIDREIEIYDKFCAPLDPDFVVLVFVSNDIDKIRGQARESLVNSHTFEYESAAASEFLFLARTAIGELLLDWSMRYRYPAYRRRLLPPEQRYTDARYMIEGGNDFARNLRIYQNRLVSRTDGIVGHAALTEQDRANLDNYAYALAHLRDRVQADGARLLFVYYPEYTQVYDPAAPMVLRDALRDICAKLDVRFLDLTDRFRAEGVGKVLHFAPVDFHPNPAGNRVIAEGVGEALLEAGR